jgi:EAL domain-containing protein (putative c-di-GMP-specific phosphodiesterase class I)
MGVAIYPRDGLDGEVLMRHADTALQDAKKDGEGQYRFFDQRMNDTLMHYVEVRDALRLALQRDELVLHYQPQIHLASGRVHGFEALVRWQRPGHGLVPPGQFIQVAEQSGLIEPMGRWALAEACRQAALWRQTRGDGWTMSVNLSGVQFRSGRVVDDVQAALTSSGLPAAMLELELTESLLLDHSDALLSQLSGWRQQGLSIAIDDFGTGYSSLSYLKHLPVDRVKIDRAFVHGLAQDRANQAIVQGVVQIACGLQLQTVAEGVEDEADLALLKAMGCDVVQGYAFARPMPAVEVSAWWDARNVQPTPERV